MKSKFFIRLSLLILFLTGLSLAGALCYRPLLLRTSQAFYLDKLDRLAADPRVCVEGDIFIRTEPTDHGITTRYESVIGQGDFEILTDHEEIVRALRVLTEHYGYMNYPLTSCRALDFIAEKLPPGTPVSRAVACRR